MSQGKFVRLLAVIGAAVAIVSGCELTSGDAPRDILTYALLDGSVAGSQAETLANNLDWEAVQWVREDGAVAWLDPSGFQAIPTLTVAGSSQEDLNVNEAYAFDETGIAALPGPLVGEEAVSTTDQALVAAGLDPLDRLKNVEATVTPRVGHSRFEWVDTNGGPRYDVRLDTHVDYEIALPGGAVESVPVIGPGASVKIVVDPLARATLVHYELWNLEADETVQVLSDNAAQEACSEALKGLAGNSTRLLGQQLDGLEAAADLVYYAPSFGSSATTLFPYFQCSGTAVIADRTIELRQTLIPAGDGIPAIFPATDVALPTRDGPTTIQPSQSSDTDVGSEWIGESQGLGGSEANAGGFVSHFNSLGTTVLFEWGDFNAWEQDFKDPTNGGDDSNWVDDADAVFYTGHANGDGFTFPGTNDDGFLRFDDARWGQIDLEWLVIAACGPLQVTSGGVEWYDRWGPAFDGLHLLLAYATVSNDNVSEGDYYARGLTGDLWFLPALPVRVSWGLAATLVQPSSVTYGYMGVSGSGGLTNHDDYFWGYGSGGSDIEPADITGFWMVLSPS